MTNPVMAAPKERRARVMKVVNVPMRTMLALPFKTPLSSRLMLVSHIGRKTGRIYRQPVSYVRDGDALLTPGGGRWIRNLQDGKPVRLHLNGRDLMARPDLVRDVDEVERLLAVMITLNGRLRMFVPFFEPDGRIDRRKLQAGVGHGFRVVRWNLDEEHRS